MLLVDFNWDALAVVPNRDRVCILVEVHSNRAHGLVTLEVVHGVDEDLV